ncbi:MAG: hypothetical protein M3Q55_06630 [Acidobacteriota bacterium]|nr:hypothetical protein [Acidobacteriota bacterium]
MGVRTLIEISVTAGFGTSIEDSFFERDFSQLDDTLDKGKATARTIVANAVDVEIPLEGITDIRFVYIEADGELSVKLFGTGGAVLSLERPIDPGAESAGEKKAVFAAHINPVSVHLSNPSPTNSINVRVLLVGDLVT